MRDSISRNNRVCCRERFVIPYRQVLWKGLGLALMARLYGTGTAYFLKGMAIPLLARLYGTGTAYFLKGMALTLFSGGFSPCMPLARLLCKLSAALQLLPVAVWASRPYFKMDFQPFAGEPARSGFPFFAWLDFWTKNRQLTRAAFLGEGIFTMGYSKNYIMYWGFLQLL